MTQRGAEGGTVQGLQLFESRAEPNSVSRETERACWLRALSRNELEPALRVDSVCKISRHVLFPSAERLSVVSCNRMVGKNLLQVHLNRQERARHPLPARARSGPDSLINSDSELIKAMTRF